jgi:hypothetical protein
LKTTSKNIVKVVAMEYLEINFKSACSKECQPCAKTR